MTACFRSKQFSASKVRGGSAHRIVLALAFFLLLPAVAIFCWQWNILHSPDNNPAAPAQDVSSLTPRSGTRPHETVMQSLPPVPNPVYGQESTAGVGDPFRSVGARAMISAEEDPFLWALMSGQGEGELVIKNRMGGIATLGPALPQNRRSQLSDREILQALQSSTGGSFRNFFSKLFGSSEHEAALSAASREAQEENPFSKIKENLNGSNAPDKAEAPVNTKEENKPAKEPAQAENKVVAPAPPPAATPANPTRPNLMMFVDAEGVLHSGSAGQQGEGTFASAELGVANFNILPFPDAAEFPISMTVADFNGDGITDVAFHIAQQGLLRFYYGNDTGSFEEGLRVDLGKGPRSLAAGDFNGDGRIDIAFSDVETGSATVLFSDPKGTYHYKSFWVDSSWDYILAADSTGSGHADLVGMTFDNHGSVLVDFTKPGGTVSARNFDFTPALSSALATAQGIESRIQAVLLSSSLSVSLDNSRGQMINVVNIAPGSNVWVILGDLSGNGKITVNIATPRP